MILSFYHLASTYFIVNSLRKDKDEFRWGEPGRIITKKIFVLDFYYYFLEHLVGQNEYGFIVMIMCCSTGVLLTLEIILFIVLEKLIERHDKDSDEKTLFWLGAFLLAEGTLLFCICASSFFCKCAGMLIRLLRARRNLAKQGMSEMDISETLRENSIYELQDSFVNGSVQVSKEENEKLTAIKEKRKEAKHENQLKGDLKPYADQLERESGDNPVYLNVIGSGKPTKGNKPKD